MYLARTPAFVQNLFPGFLWRSETSANEVYLTFDDGPVPEVTPWVLDELQKYSAHGTFFCVGENVAKHPHIYERILNEGHTVGNHTYNHLSGWTCNTKAYMDNVSDCAKLVQSDLFRPPYGRVGIQLAKLLREENYRIVMWDVLSGDFDRELNPDQCYLNVIENTRPGSIIVFHDSIKAQQNLCRALPKVLAFFAEKGYICKSLQPGRVGQERLLKIA